MTAPQPPTDLTGLPPGARTLAECIGLTALLDLVEAYGGQSLRVPVEPRAEGRLWQVLGPAAYEELIFHYRAEVIEVPLLHTSRQRLFEAQILADLAAGARVTDLVHRYRIGRTSIARIARRARERANQGAQLALSLNQPSEETSNV